MRGDRPSWTAQVVAASRALATDSRAAVCDPGDGAVKRLLPLEVRVGLAALKATGLAAFAVRVSAGFVDHIALRAAILDHHVELAVESGIEQLVILGAGLDTRAHRLACLSDADVFEVDHPSTQRGKEEAARDLPTTARKLVHVSVDFERERATDRLAQSGHNAAARTIWLLEGVVPYLSEGALSGLLSEISAASAPGSQLALTYVPADAPWLKLGGPVLRMVLSVAGEPFESPITGRALADLLRVHGMAVEHDSAPAEWVRELGAAAEGHRIMTYERLVIATKP